MKELWRGLPWWVRRVVVPIVLVIVAWNLLSVVFSVVFGVLGWLFAFAIKALVIVALGAAVVVLVKKASRM
jgi:hypothetical protein